MINAKQKAEAVKRLTAQKINFQPNGFQRTNLGTITGTIIDMQDLDISALNMPKEIKSYAKVFVVGDDGSDYTLRAVNKSLTGDETEFQVAAGKSSDNNYYIMEAK